MLYLFTAGLAISLIASSTTYAAGTANSEASVNFTAPEEPVAPVDPTDPSKPNTESPEENGNVTGQDGPLSLDYVSHIDFGDQEVSTTEKVYKSITTEPYIQVTDVSGTGNGWQITAQASTFTSNENNTETLPAASIQFNDGDTISTSTSESPKVEQTINLVTGGDAQEIVTAAPRIEGESVNTAQGLGTWVTRWLASESDSSNENVTLTVPGSVASVGGHTAQISWTLSNGPGTGE